MGRLTNTPDENGPTNGARSPHVGDRSPSATAIVLPDRGQRDLVSAQGPFRPAFSTYRRGAAADRFSEREADPETVRSRLCATQRTIASTITPAPGMIQGGKRTVTIAAPIAARLPICRRQRDEAMSTSAATTAYQIDELASAWSATSGTESVGVCE